MVRIDKIRSYYKNMVSSSDEKQFFKQVGKTVNGKEIDKAQLKLVINRIINALKINEQDLVLDMGCGNGLITSRIARYARFIKGIDISKELLVIARKYHGAENIEYVEDDCLKTDTQGIVKYYMYEVIQHMEYSGLPKLLNNIQSSNNAFSLFIGSIPDPDKIYSFYDSREKRRFYIKSLEDGESHLGNWWHKKHLQTICEERGITLELMPQDTALYTAHYRYDALLTKTNV